jgi:hypothetical protein
MVNINPFYKGQAQARRAMSGPGPKATDARLKAMREANKIPALRVEPVSDDVRANFVHVPTGRKFRSAGSIELPDDRFTQRRIAEGVIKRVEENKQEEKETRPAHSLGAAGKLQNN